MVKSIEALNRGLGVVEVLSRSGALSLSEIQHEAKLPKATVQRILKTLFGANWIYCGLGDGKYRLRSGISLRKAPGFLELLAEVGGPLIDSLRERTGYPSDINVRDDYAMRIIESSRRQARVGLHYHVIGLRPHMLWSAAGRAYFAFCPDDERQELVDHLARSSDWRDRIAGVPKLLEKLVSETRARGFAVREPGYWREPRDKEEAATEAIAVPVESATGVLATINLLWPAGSLTLDKAARDFLPLLLEVAEALKVQATSSTSSITQEDRRQAINPVVC